MHCLGHYRAKLQFLRGESAEWPSELSKAIAPAPESSPTPVAQNSAPTPAPLASTEAQAVGEALGATLTFEELGLPKYKSAGKGHRAGDVCSITYLCFDNPLTNTDQLGCCPEPMSAQG